MPAEILIIDDEADIRDLIAGILQDEGYETRLAATAKEAEASVNERLPTLVILDVWLKGSDMDGLELLERIKTTADVPVIIISGHGTLEMAITATKMGAEDFLPKPFEAAQLLHSIERALNEVALRRENNELRVSLGDLAPQWIGESAAAQEIMQISQKMAQSSSRLFIWGETGVGKATLARTIHQTSERASGRFIVLNCAAVAETDFEAELLGVEVDGRAVKIGAMEHAHNGTLLLEDIDKMPLEFQKPFAKILQSNRFTRAGGERAVSVDARVMVTSLFEPQDLQKRGVVQDDLYHRLNVHDLHIPPLRTRREDIVPYFHRFMRLRAAALRCPEPHTQEAGVALLQAYDWRGNLRQMKNIVARLLGEGRGDEITAALVEACLNSDDSLASDKGDENRGLSDFMHDDLRAARHSFEKEYLRFHLQRFNGNIAKTADFVGMERTALHRKLKSLELL